MARMNPSRLPDRVLNDRKLKGEIDTFEALSKLSDEFEVFYNRCVSDGLTARGYERRIDFIVLHEQLGLLAIEVKGGRISIGADGGFEQYQHRAGKEKPIDPFAQVKLALRDLIKTCKKDGAKYWIPDNVCVVFPGTGRSELTDKPQQLPAGTLCADDIPILSVIVPKLFSKNDKGRAWKRDEFIDMRRRLQNMPEAERKKSSKTSKAYSPRPKGVQRPRRQDVEFPRIYRKKKQKLKWWEIMLALMVGCITFCLVYGAIEKALE